MLKVLAVLPEAEHFRQIGKKGDRFQWCDRSTDLLRILSDTPDPWGKEWSILIRLEQGKNRNGSTYPKRLNLLCLPPDRSLPKAKLVRDRWHGNFAHSTEPTLLHFDFPIQDESASTWLMLSVIQK